MKNRRFSGKPFFSTACGEKSRLFWHLYWGNWLERDEIQTTNLNLADYEAD